MSLILSTKYTYVSHFYFYGWSKFIKSSIEYNRYEHHDHGLIPVKHISNGLTHLNPSQLISQVMENKLVSECYKSPEENHDE